MTRLAFKLLKVGHCVHPECVAMRGGSWRSAQFPALAGLLAHPTRGWILFDTGYSNHFDTATGPFPERFYRWVTPYTLPQEQTLLAQLRAMGIGPEDIACVIVSHMHGDHIAGARDLPRARFITLRAEYDTLRARSRVGNLLHGTLPGLLPADFQERVEYADDAPSVALPSELQPFDRGFDLFGDGSVIGIPLPGHSSGQLGILFRQNDDRYSFMVADACWSKKALESGRGPSWVARRIFSSSQDYAATFARLRQLAAQAHAPALIPSHCETTWEALRHDAV